MSDADRLRAAAERLREVAGAAPPGPWRFTEGTHGNPSDGPTYTAILPSQDVGDEPLATGDYDAYSGYALILAALMSSPSRWRTGWTERPSCRPGGLPARPCASLT